MLATVLQEIAALHEAVHRAIHLIKEVRHTMATKADVDAAVKAITDEVSKLGADVAAFVQSLKDQIAAGQDLTDTLAGLQGVADKLQAIDETIPEQTPTE